MAPEIDSPAFTIQPEHYERLINWDKRLAREAPFFRSHFEQAGVKAVLDAACGVGRHAEMFASWGLDVTAVDNNAEMIDHCRTRYAKQGNLEFDVCDLRDLSKRRDTFDAVVCVGNSIALLPTISEMLTAVEAAASRVAPGGILILHVLNLWAWTEDQLRWQKCEPIDDQLTILKGVRRCGSRGFVEFVLVERTDDTAKLVSESIPFLGVDRQELAGAVQRAGLRCVSDSGSYDDKAFDVKASSDLIFVASRD